MPVKMTLSDREIYEFLPAAIEIERSPAPLAGRAVLWSIMALFLIALLWACLGKVDVVAVAQGKVIPSERVKQIQPLETATIAAIHVQEGARVKAGDPLITLDPTNTEADVRRYQKEWKEASAQYLRVSALADWLERGAVGIPEMTKDAQLDSRLFTSQQSLLSQEASEYHAKVEGLNNEIERIEFEQKMTRAEIEKQKRLLPVMKERVDSLQKLYQQQYVARSQYLELQQQLIEVEQNLLVAQAKLQTSEASLETTRSQLQALKHEQLKNTLSKKQDLEVQVSGLAEEKTKAERRAQQYKIISPIDGTVQQLMVHTLGGVVTPAQVLMNVVPENGVIEVEAYIQNQDVGFVKQGQTAEVKVETFNFTKYGMIDAELVSLSEDAIQDEKNGLIYRAIFRMKQTKLLVDGNWVKLLPGMNVTAEIKTGGRRIIEYFLSPLLKHGQESIRER